MARSKAKGALRSTAPPKILTGYQSRVVTSPWFEALDSGQLRARIETWVKSRRVGGSTGAAYRACLWAAGYELQEDGSAIAREPVDVIVVSKDFTGSKRLLREVEDARQDLARAGPEFDGVGHATTIHYANGRTITALPCSDKAIRGNTSAFVADEFAFWRQQEPCWGALKSVSDPNLKYPTGLPGLIITTAWESGSLAHRICTDDSFPFGRHVVDIYQAIADGFPIDAARAFAELGIPELIDTEYLCKWSKGGSSFFPESKLRDCTVDVEVGLAGEEKCGLPEGWQRAPARLGVDCGGGKGRDFTALVLWRLIHGAWWMVGVKASNIIGTVDMADIAADWMLDEGIVDPSAELEIRCDEGIMGADFIRQLAKRLKDRKRTTITGVGINPIDQERFAISGRRLLERGQLRLYTGTDAGGDEHGCRALMLEMSQLKARPGNGGRLTFATPRDPTKGHLDRAWAGLIGLEEADELTTRVQMPTRQQMRRLLGHAAFGNTGRGYG
jgi:hypothetical protein